MIYHSFNLQSSILNLYSYFDFHMFLNLLYPSLHYQNEKYQHHKKHTQAFLKTFLILFIINLLF